MRKWVICVKSSILLQEGSILLQEAPPNLHYISSGHHFHSLRFTSSSLTQRESRSGPPINLQVFGDFFCIITNMKHFLLKSEPNCFGIDDLARVKQESWTGVRNYQARNTLRNSMSI